MRMSTGSTLSHCPFCIAPFLPRCRVVFKPSSFKPYFNVSVRSSWSAEALPLFLSRCPFSYCPASPFKVGVATFAAAIPKGRSSDAGQFLEAMKARICRSLSWDEGCDWKYPSRLWMAT